MLRAGDPQIKAVLFDLDDTLWPIAPLMAHAEQTLHSWIAIHAPEVAQRYSIEQLRHRRMALIPTDARFEYDLWALRHTALAQVFQEMAVDVRHADEAMQVFAKARNQVALFDDVMPALQKLSAHVVMGAISNGFADVNAVGLGPYFRIALAAHQFGCAKPDRRIFLAAAEMLALAPQEIMYVGDNLALDVLGAQQAGMRGVWMNRWNTAPDDSLLHIKPDAIVTDLHGIVDCIN